MAKVRIPIDSRDWYYVDEFAEATGNTEQYVRELCNIQDKDKGIKATKCGKTWRIPKSERDRKLGIKLTDEEYKKDLYIKELESQIKVYKIKIDTMENLLKSAASVLQK